uniref:Uncharacterized protein n=1 Tax=Triticum urartu TaxID=4572 RepID=A0A8R7PZZ5_TRIUA
MRHPPTPRRCWMASQARCGRTSCSPSWAPTAPASPRSSTRWRAGSCATASVATSRSTGSRPTAAAFAPSPPTSCRSTCSTPCSPCARRCCSPPSSASRTLSPSAKRERVDQLIDQLGLSRAADTIIG